MLIKKLKQKQCKRCQTQLLTRERPYPYQVGTSRKTKNYEIIHGITDDQHTITRTGYINSQPYSLAG